MSLSHFCWSSRWDTCGNIDLLDLCDLFGVMLGGPRVGLNNELKIWGRGWVHPPPPPPLVLRSSQTSKVALSLSPFSFFFFLFFLSSSFFFYFLFFFLGGVGGVQGPSGPPPPPPKIRHCYSGLKCQNLTIFLTVLTIQSVSLCDFPYFSQSLNARSSHNILNLYKIKLTCDYLDHNL